MLGQGKKYYLRTYGCQANERDSETLAGILEEMNFTAVEHPEDADVILMNTCAIRKNAEDKVLGEIGSPETIEKQKSGYAVWSVRLHGTGGGSCRQAAEYISS